MANVLVTEIIPVEIPGSMINGAGWERKHYENNRPDSRNRSFPDATSNPLRFG